MEMVKLPIEFLTYFAVIKSSNIKKDGLWFEVKYVPSEIWF